MTKVEDLKERILAKGRELIEMGKIPLKDEHEWLEAELAEERRANKLIKNEIGLLSNIAIRYGVTITTDPEEDEGITFLKIKDLETRINVQDNETVGIKGKVTRGCIAKIPKKDKDGNRLKGEFKELAKIEVSDETGICNYTQWEYVSDGRNVFEELFEDVKAGTIIGKTIVLKKIKASRSGYTGHDVNVEVMNGGRVDFEEKQMVFEKPKYKTTSIKSTLGSKDAYFYLLKVTLEPTIGEGKRGTYQLIPVVDTEGVFAKVNLWYPESGNVKAKVGDILLVEGRVEEESYKGKMYKKINIWRQGESVLEFNPDGYMFAKEKKEFKVKTLANAQIDDAIQATVMIKRFFKKKPYYLACPVVVDFDKDKRCGKGVNLVGNKWMCNANHELSDEEADQSEKVLVMSGEVVDEITMPFSIFDRGHQQFPDGTEKESIMMHVLGRDKDELINEYDMAGDELFYERINQEIGTKWFKINAIVDLDTYKGRPSLKITSIEPVNPAEEMEAIKDRLIAPV